MTRKVISDSDVRSNNGKIRGLLVEGEERVVDSAIHGAIYWRAVAVFIVAVLLFVFVAPELGFFFAIVSGIMALYAYAMSQVLMLTLTNKRILSRVGLLQVDVIDIAFDKIGSIELERMAPGMIFGYSNVVIMGTGQRMITIPFVKNGIQFRRAFSEFSLT
jgi:hypothetical protein